MKKNRLLIIVFVLTLFSSCTIAKVKIPYGIWESADPAIVAYISPDITEEDIVQGNTFHASYVAVSGEIKDLSVLFNKIDGRMMIHEKIQWKDGGESYNIYFSGSYTVKKNTLTLHVIDQEFAGTDYKEIVFTKIQDYEEATE